MNPTGEALFALELAKPAEFPRSKLEVVEKQSYFQRQLRRIHASRNQTKTR